jgi:hypothetical protein
LRPAASAASVLKINFGIENISASIAAGEHALRANSSLPMESALHESHDSGFRESRIRDSRLAISDEELKVPVRGYEKEGSAENVRFSSLAV